MTDKEKLQKVIILVDRLSNDILVLDDKLSFKETKGMQDYIILVIRLFLDFERDIQNLINDEA